MPKKNDEQTVKDLARLLSTPEGAEQVLLQGNNISPGWVLLRLVRRTDVETLIDMGMAKGVDILAGIVLKSEPKSRLKPGSGVFLFPAAASRVGEKYAFVEEKACLLDFAP